MELLSVGKIMLILIVALLIFGPQKLPEMGKAAGEALKEFKKGLQSEKSASSDSIEKDND
ncbi:twin-arginine translocase TatA/TatE family subunit [Aeribacillus sp. FSL W8-0870]|uniref:twin-arginine translocase TatA/TatE family subunit n=1 Tax=Aeribacillus sp. FSL W8-0870 TaxID=2954706 RepID=UPI0030CA7395